MLNRSVKREAIDKLEGAVAKHEKLRKKTVKASKNLFKQRNRASHEVIQQVENYVNLLANSPKSFEKSVAEYRIEVNRFDHHVDSIKKDETFTSNIGSAAAATGAVAGVGVAALGPTAAMAVATTFGAASTGTAISALSGAAATNAALAWLGGGALAAGGSGMAGGSAFLALAGPVGWTIAGTAIVGSGLYMRHKNREYAEEAKERQIKVEAETRSLVLANSEIKGLAHSTKAHADGCLSDLQWLTERAPRNYLEFTNDKKEHLQALINHIRSLSKLLNKQVAC